MTEELSNLQPRKEISAEEFIKIWRGDYKGSQKYSHYYKDDGTFVYIRGHKILGEVNIETQTLLFAEFEDLYFQNSIHIKSSVLSTVYIKKTRINILFITDRTKLNSITFEESTLNGLHIANATIDYTFFVKSSISSLHVQSAKIRSLLLNEVNAGDSSFYNSTIEEYSIHKSYQGHIHFFNTSVTKELYITGYTCIGKLNVLDSSVMERIWLRDIVISPHVHFKNSIIRKTLFSQGTVIGELYIDYINRESKTLEIYSSTINKLQINTDNPYKIIVGGKPKERSSINFLNLFNTVIPKDFYLHISDTDINDLSFDSSINNGVIVFNGVRPPDSVRRFKLDKSSGRAIRNDSGDYEFEEVNDSTSSIIEISNSDLGNTQFIGCDLDLFYDFEFENSKLLNVFIADTALPKKENINRDLPDDYEQRRLALSQFKKIYESQGDVVRATIYRAEEMEVYREQLKTDDSRMLSNNWFNNRSERLNLGFNKFSNYHGNNWLKASVITLSATWIFFTLYCYALGYKLGGDLKMFLELFSYSFEFLNPIRKGSTLGTEHDITPLARIIDYVGRIFIAYFVYQTISAFRKFGKRSN